MTRRRGEQASPAVECGRRPVVGRRLMRVLDSHLQHLRDVQTHGNRVLQYDHVVVAHLIAFFNPTIDSLRLIERLFEHERPQKLFKLPPVKRSTLADAQRLFDPAVLQPIVSDLAERIQRAPGGDQRLDELTRAIVAVDATFFEVASRIAWALPHNPTSARGSVQMCLHFDVLDGVPVGFSLLGGQQHEGPELSRRIQPNTLYLLDRAYQSYQRLDAITQADSDFVVRLRHSANFNVVEKRPLTATDRAAQIIGDQVVTPANPRLGLSTPVRLVEIVPPTAGVEPVRLLTNRLDLPAELIGVLYRHRWQIELFFRWLKCVVRQQRFMSESADGITLQLYVALIGTLLIMVETGERPSKYDFATLSLVASGMLTLDEVLAGVARRRRAREQTAANAGSEKQA